MRLAAGLLALACGSTFAQTPGAPAGVQGGSIAEVVYAQGQLVITADNSSLNQILRGISRQTGMKITGGVADDRVYGRYGPAPPREILATLLAGTGTNMLLRETASGAPAELVLAPRQGGPTPPSPGSSAPESERQAPPATLISGRVAGPANRQGTALDQNGQAAGLNPEMAPDGFQTQQQIAEHLQKVQEMQRQLGAKPR